MATDKMATVIVLALASLIPHLYAEYIPPGPKFPCPKDADKPLLYPCICEKGTDDGIHVYCENTGLASISVGIGNIAGLNFPIEKLTLKECAIANLFGPLFHRSSIKELHIVDTPIEEIDQYAFVGVNKTLKQLYITNSKLPEFPAEAFKILGNLTILKLDGHKIIKLNKNTFAGSEMAGIIERLHIVNGLIDDITPDTFQNLKKLKTLDLHGNRLSTLKKSQFKGLRETEVLDISYNNITKLDGSHIGDLTKLGWCNASHNNIGDMPRGMFARNTLIKVVHLDNNRIKKLDSNTFRGMRFLRRLYLQDNEISDIGKSTFASVTRIGTIDLARNKLKIVDYQMFQAVKYAEVINLAENNITKIENQAFTDLYLATVNISFNQLEKIEGNAFVNCNNLTVLDLSHNKLEEITKSAFDENTYAFELQVSYNLFTDFGMIPIQNMSGLRIVNASYNNIQIIPRNSFPKLYELHTVDISHNNLSEIYNAIFQNLFSLRYLNLSHNSLTTIKPSTFGSVPTILSLDLSHNKLKDISRGSLAKLPSCSLLDVSFNQLDKIFQIPISLSELNIAHNNLEEIKSNTWPSMNALLRLNLSDNKLTDSLSDTTFESLLTLQKLDLTNNGISSPPWQALSKLASLQYLYLAHNNLTELSKSAFGNLLTTFELDLSYNQLHTIGPRSFLGLQQLLKLSLKGNKLEYIPNEAFKSLVALRNLDLSYNMIEKINNKTHGLLDDCLSLEKINLSHNKFELLTKKMFPSNPWIPYKLYEVDLSYNSIPVLTIDLIHGTNKLKKLNLSNNIINEIRNYIIGNLTSLQILDLSNNDLKDLMAKGSLEKSIDFPENITEIYLQNNKLEMLPVDKIINKKMLKILDLRNNMLSTFEPGFVEKMMKNDLQVFFEGNQLYCNCLARPLKHYLNHFKKSDFLINSKYNITCVQPPGLADENIMTLDEERLICAGNVLNEYKNSNTDEFSFTSEPDLVFRDIQYAQSAIYVHWFVKSNADLADTFLSIKNNENKLFVKQNVIYNTRSITVMLENDLKNALNNGESLQICIQAKNSKGNLRKWFNSQCKDIPKDFSDWPIKLVVDKRRITKKKVRYSWFSRNSALALLSDSILITLCIFLGVLFRRMSDFNFD